MSGSDIFGDDGLLNKLFGICPLCNQEFGSRPMTNIKRITVHTVCSLDKDKWRKYLAGEKEKTV